MIAAAVPASQAHPKYRLKVYLLSVGFESTFRFSFTLTSIAAKGIFIITVTLYDRNNAENPSFLTTC